MPTQKEAELNDLIARQAADQETLGTLTADAQELDEQLKKLDADPAASGGSAAPSPDDLPPPPGGAPKIGDVLEIEQKLGDARKAYFDDLAKQRAEDRKLSNKIKFWKKDGQLVPNSKGAYDQLRAELDSAYLAGKRQELADAGKSDADIEKELGEYHLDLFSKMRENERSLQDRATRLPAKKQKLLALAMEKTAGARNGIVEGAKKGLDYYQNMGKKGHLFTAWGYEITLGKIGRSAIMGALGVTAGTTTVPMVGLRILNGIVAGAGSAAAMRYFENKKKDAVDTIDSKKNAADKGFKEGTMTFAQYEAQLQATEKKKADAERKYNMQRAAVLILAGAGSYGAGHGEHALGWDKPLFSGNGNAGTITDALNKAPAHHGTATHGVAHLKEAFRGHTLDPKHPIIAQNSAPHAVPKFDPTDVKAHVEFSSKGAEQTILNFRHSPNFKNLTPEQQTAFDGSVVKIAKQLKEFRPDAADGKESVSFLKGSQFNVSSEGKIFITEPGDKITVLGHIDGTTIKADVNEADLKYIHAGAHHAAEAAGKAHRADPESILPPKAADDSLFPKVDPSHGGVEAPSAKESIFPEVDPSAAGGKDSLLAPVFSGSAAADTAHPSIFPEVDPSAASAGSADMMPDVDPSAGKALANASQHVFTGPEIAHLRHVANMRIEKQVNGIFTYRTPTGQIVSGIDSPVWKSASQRWVSSALSSDFRYLMPGMRTLYEQVDALAGKYKDISRNQPIVSFMKEALIREIESDPRAVS